MKKQLFFLALLFSISCFCKAKDSTLVFKFSAGLFYNKPILPEAYNRYFQSHGGSGNSSLSYTDTLAFAPLVQVAVQKRFGKQAGVQLQIGATRSKYAYSRDDDSKLYPVIPGTTGLRSTQTVKTTVRPLLLNAALGFVLYAGNVYFVPRADLAYLHYTSMTDSSGTTSNFDGSNATSYSHLKTTKSSATYTGGGGLLIGYDFHVERLLIFLQLQADIYDQPKHFYPRNALNAAFTLGIGF